MSGLIVGGVRGYDSGIKSSHYFHSPFIHKYQGSPIKKLVKS